MFVFLNTLQTEPLKDLLVAGFIALEEFGLKFNPNYDKLYFLFPKKIYELKLNTEGFIETSEVIKLENDFRIDEDDRFCFMSIYNQAFKTESSISIKVASCANERFSPVIIEYLTGEQNRKLLIDPLSFFGFVIHNEIS